MLCNVMEKAVGFTGSRKW